MRIVAFVMFFSVVALSWGHLATALTFNSPLVDAADVGDKQKVLRLLKQGHKPDEKGDFGVTPLMRAAFRGNVDLVQLLVESGAYVDASDIGGDAALHLAARNGHANVVDALLEYDAYVDIPDKEKWTPLMRAVMAKQTNVAKLLIAKGADITAVNEMDESVIIHAAMIGRPEIMELILGNKEFQTIPLGHRSTALEIAERKNNQKVGKMLASMSGYLKKQVADKKTEERFKQAQIDRSSIYEGENYSEDKYNTAGIIEKFESRPPRNVRPEPFQSSPEVSRPPSFEQAYGAQSPSEKIVPNPSDGVPSSPVLSEPILDASMPYDILARPTPAAPPIIKPKSSQKIAEIKKSLKGYQEAFPEEFNKPQMPSPISKPERFELDDEDFLSEGEKFYSVQLGAFSSEQYTAFVWENMQKKNADLLARLSADIVPESARGSNKILYKLRSGRFKWKDVAESTCSSLKTRNIDCIVVGGSLQNYAGALHIGPAVALEPETVMAKRDMGVPLPVARAEAVSQRVDAGASVPSKAAVAKVQDDELPWLKRPSRQPIDYGVPQQMAQAPMQNMPKYNTPPFQSAPQPQNQYVPQPPARGFADTGSDPIDINPYAGAYRRGAQVPAYNQVYNNLPPQPAAGDIRSNIDQQVRELARQRFFEERGVKKPEVKRDYGDFYNEIGRQAQNRSQLSEAVLVPNSNYQLGFARGVAGGVWLHIESFFDKNAANDYGTRMFRYDENLRGLNIMLVNSEDAIRQNAVAMRVGPLAYEQANSLCSTVMAGGLRCSVKGGGATTPAPSYAKRESINRFWINLGTFADTPEAEYYWMFLREDNGDLLSALEYDMANAGEHGAFGDDAVQLRLGPFDARGRASQICNVMKYRNVACLVQ